MSKLLQTGMTGCVAILLAAMLTTPATARIECRGNFQMTKYGPIATPYCEEEQIAFVARSYGQRVTAAAVHISEDRAQPCSFNGATPDGAPVRRLALMRRDQP